MPDPGDTKAGDRGQGAGWSKTSPSTKPSGGGGSGPRGPESSWGTRGSPTGGSLTGGQLSGYNGGGGKTNTPTGPRGPQSSWGTRGSPTGGKLTGGQLSRYGGGGSPGGALSAGLGGNYTPSVPGGLRGITGPLGEPRVQPTPYGTNYQTAQMYRAAYPRSVGRYSQERVTNALNTFSKAIPGEADYNRFGEAAFPNIARVGLNQIIGGYRPEKMVAGMDTTGLRPATQGFEFAGPNSIGMTDNWRDPIKGAAYQALASVGIQDALFNRGVSPVAQNASNFVAAGTPMVRGVDEVGDPVYGTQYGADPTWGNRIENRNTAALNGPVLSDNRTEIAGALSAPDATAPLRVAQAGMSGGLFSATAAPQQPTAPDAPIGPVLDAPYSNLFDKEDRLDVAENFVPSWMQSDYTGPRQAVAEANVPSWRQSSYTGRENVVPSYAQSTYTGPIDTVMNTPDPITPAASPSEPDIPFPVSTDSMGYKVWRGLTRVGDSLFPGSGMMLRAMDDDLRERWPSMTNEERQALIDKWERQNRPSMSNASYVTGGSYEPKRGGDGPIVRPMIRPEEPSKNKAPKKEAEDASWKQDALAYGFTEAQLKDPEIAAYIKQLWDMGWIPNSA